MLQKWDLRFLGFAFTGHNMFIIPNQSLFMEVDFKIKAILF